MPDLTDKQFIIERHDRNDGDIVYEIWTHDLQDRIAVCNKKKWADYICAKAKAHNVLAAQIAKAGEGMPDFRQEIYLAISDMLDHPGECGIYPTTKCYDRLENYFRAYATARIAALEERCDSLLRDFEKYELVEQRAEEVERKLASVREETIEECAKVCESLSNGYVEPITCHEIKVSIAANSSCAKAIRALRGKP